MPNLVVVLRRGNRTGVCAVGGVCLEARARARWGRPSNAPPERSQGHGVEGRARAGKAWPRSPPTPGTQAAARGTRARSHRGARPHPEAVHQAWGEPGPPATRPGRQQDCEQGGSAEAPGRRPDRWPGTRAPACAMGGLPSVAGGLPPEAVRRRGRPRGFPSGAQPTSSLGPSFPIVQEAWVAGGSHAGLACLFMAHEPKREGRSGVVLLGRGGRHARGWEPGCKHGAAAHHACHPPASA